MKKFLISRRGALAITLASALFSIAPAITPALANDTKLDLIDAKTISVGTLADSKPTSFVTADGKFTGFDIDLFLNIAERLGFKEDQVVFTGQDFTALMPSVTNQRFDVAAAAIGTTEERKKNVDFSDGYLIFYLAILTNEKDLKDVSNLKGKRVGVVQGTLTDIYATKNFTDADIVRFPDNNAAVAALNNGTIAAHFLDRDPALQYIDRYPTLGIGFDIPSLDTPAGFVVRKGNDSLRNGINEALQAAINDGTYKKLYEKWFPGAPITEHFLPKK